MAHPLPVRQTFSTWKFPTNQLWELGCNLFAHKPQLFGLISAMGDIAVTRLQRIFV